MDQPGELWTPADPSQSLTVTLVLRPSSTSAAIGLELLDGTYDISSATQATLGPDPADLQAALDFIQQSGLQLVGQDADARSIQVSGTVHQLECAFGIALGIVSHARNAQPVISYKGDLIIPAALAGPVIAILGLDQRPIARHHISV